MDQLGALRLGDKERLGKTQNNHVKAHDVFWDASKGLPSGGD